VSFHKQRDSNHTHKIFKTIFIYFLLYFLIERLKRHTFPPGWIYHSSIRVDEHDLKQNKKHHHHQQQLKSMITNIFSFGFLIFFLPFLKNGNKKIKMRIDETTSRSF